MAKTIRAPFRNGRDVMISLSRPSRHDRTLPVVPMAEVIDEGVSLVAAQPLAVDGNVSAFEGLVLGAIIATRGPQRIFEFGTFDGRTSLIMAANAPTAEIFTLDLPADQIADAALTIGAGDVNYIDKAEIGARIPSSPHAPHITMLRGDSATFDYSPYHGSVDVAFVDACHEYDYVLSDSRHAATMLRSTGGTIVWHDYSVWTGVTKALNELHRSGEFGPLRRIDGTTMVITDLGSARRTGR
jgi:predicted O-methyltransferase YrrM